MKNSNSIEWDIYVNMNLLSAVFGHMHLFRVTTSIALHPYLVYPTFSDISIIYFSSPHLSFLESTSLTCLSFQSLFVPSSFNIPCSEVYMLHSTHPGHIYIAASIWFFSNTYWPWCYIFVSLFSLHILCFGKLYKKAT